MGRYRYIGALICVLLLALALPSLSAPHRGSTMSTKYARGRFGGIVGERFTPPEFARYVDGLNLSKWQPDFVVLHNTWLPHLSAWGTVTGETRMRNLARYYASKGWRAGPHLFIADDFIWIFSPLTAPGTHSPSFNSQSWGVEVVGDYDVESFSGGVRSNTIAALATLHNRAGIDPASLKLHRDDPGTSHHGCPGRGIVRAEVIAEVMALLHPITVMVHGRAVPHTGAHMDGDRVMVALRAVATALGWAVYRVGDGKATLGRGMAERALPVTIQGSSGYVRAADLRQLGATVDWDGHKRQLSISAP